MTEGAIVVVAVFAGAAVGLAIYRRWMRVLDADRRLGELIHARRRYLEASRFRERPGDMCCPSEAEVKAGRVLE